MEFIRPKKSSLGLDMTPMIDIVFQLLIFFMLSSSFLTPTLRLNLPKAVTQDNRETEHVVVSVNKTGEVYINHTQSSMEALKLELEAVLTKTSKKYVRVQGDQDMPYKFFVQVMDLARQAGATQVHIAHDTEKT